MISTEHTSLNNSSWTRSGRHSPCPICGRTKDQDCTWKDDIKLCHTYIDQDAEASSYVYRGATKDGMWGQYFPQEEKQHRRQKSIRPKSKPKEFIYLDNNRQPLVKVTRIDKGDNNKSFSQSHWDGKEWVRGLTDEVKSQIHLYRIHHEINSKAIY